MNTLFETDFSFDNILEVHKGKVRDVYFIRDKAIMIATDRISAFDVILPKPIPFKGQILSEIAYFFLQETKNIVPNWVETSPDPNVIIGQRCEVLPVEMIIRGYLCGHAWRTYQQGIRTLCGVDLPEGLKENSPLPFPIITPTTKAYKGHDENISKEQIIEEGILSRVEYELVEKYTFNLFQKGQALARERGLILADTKYEFGKNLNGDILLIDEIHTPDSSRYFYLNTYQEAFDTGQPQRQLSKEYVRQWLISEGFLGQENQSIPDLSQDIIKSISQRYIELYTLILNKPFVENTNNIKQRIEENISKYLNFN